MLEQILGDIRDNDEVIRGQVFSGEVLAELDLSGIEFEEVTFDHCRFINCDFSYGNLFRTQFLSCDFSNCRFAKSYWNQSGISESKGDGAAFTESTFKCCEFRDSVFHYANLPQTQWEDIKMTGCSFGHASFQAAKFKRIEMRDVVLSGAEFFRSSLKGVDLSQCAIDGIWVSESMKELRGVKINPGQAVDLISLLGIEMI